MARTVSSGWETPVLGDECDKITTTVQPASTPLESGLDLFLGW